jgi:hypothetical protein
MNRIDTPAENIRVYLRQLTPQTRTRLLAEVERLRLNGDEVPGADIILSELRTEVRPDSQPENRLDPAARSFFRVLEPLLTNRPSDRAHAGQISRASLMPIWDWIGRDLMASLTRGYAAEMKQFLAANRQREAEQAVQAFQNKAVKYLEGTLASSNGVEQARKQLTARGGAPATLDDLARMLRVLKARDALAKFAQRLPAKIDKLVGERLESVRAMLDALAADQREAVPFGLTLVARHLTAPWQLVRLATKATETKDAAEIAAAPYAMAVGMVLDLLDDEIEALRDALRKERLPIAKEVLANIYDIEYAVRVRINLSGSPWGERLDASMAMVSTVLETEVHNLPEGLRHVLKSSGLKQHLSLVGRVTRLGWKCRDAVTGGVTHGRHLVDAVRNSYAWSLFQ